MEQVTAGYLTFVLCASAFCAVQSALCVYFTGRNLKWCRQIESSMINHMLEIQRCVVEKSQLNAAVRAEAEKG